MTVDGPFRRGEVVWGSDPFKESERTEPERPFLVLSNDAHPFAHRQFAGVVLSTTPREEAVELSPDDWYVGGLPRQSYVYPWLPVTRDHADIASVYGRLEPAIVEVVFDHLTRYLSGKR